MKAHNVPLAPLVNGRYFHSFMLARLTPQVPMRFRARDNVNHRAQRAGYTRVPSLARLVDRRSSRGDLSSGAPRLVANGRMRFHELQSRAETWLGVGRARGRCFQASISRGE